MSEKVISIDVETVNKVERAHYEYNSYVDIERAYLDSHMADKDASAFDSPIYRAYHEKCVDALKAYEEAKSEMVEKYGVSGQNWNLDFKSKEITIP